MTEKKEKILQSALELFAGEGYFATSTSKIAKLAGVSEGLIFRHFENKEGLLKAVIGEGEARFKSLYAEIVMETDPEKVIAKTIDLPFSINESEYEFWKLQFKLKWELKEKNPQKMEPMIMALTNAFKKLNYEKPEMEAELAVLILEGVSSAILKGTISDKNRLKSFLMKKYNL